MRRLAFALFAGARLAAADPAPSQAAGAANPPYAASALGSPFPDANYGADHGGSSLALSFPFFSRFGGTDHSRGIVTFRCAPFFPRRSEGVYGIDVWLEEDDGVGSWHPVSDRAGLPDGVGSPYVALNTPNPGPSAACVFQWTFDATPLPASVQFRVFCYTYLYNQGGGSQGNFYVASTLGPVSSGLANDAPRIAWTASFGSVNPTQVGPGQSYAISAEAQDDNGNLSSVSIWKNGVLCAAAGPADGWSSIASASFPSDPSGSYVYAAAAVDAMGQASPTISLPVSVAGKTAQPSVASSDAVASPGTPFTPSFSGGAGTGGWQFVVEGYTNWNGGSSADTGTLFADGTWQPAWVPPLPGGFQFWIARDGDAQYAPSALAGPYSLAAVGPASSLSGAPTITPSAPGLLPGEVGSLPTAPSSDPSAPATPPASSSSPTPAAPPPGPPPLPPPPAPPAPAPSPGPVPPPVIAPSTPATPQYTLTTTALGPGQVTAGGVYPANSIVTLAATPSATGKFTFWLGSLPGYANPFSVTMTSDLTVTAVFSNYYTQSIYFPAPPDGTFPGPNVPLIATASSGLAVSLRVIGGAGSIVSSQYVPAATGYFLIEADQGGSPAFQPATPVWHWIHIAAARPDIARIRFSATGTQAKRGSGSAISTDPAGLQLSPWPSFTPLQPATTVQQALPLPPPPSR